MPEVKPFAALRPRPELAARICELPYDVLSSDEARALADGNPLSFFHVSKPEIDLPPDTDLYADVVYETGRKNFARLIADDALQRDAQPRFHVYRQVMGAHQQTGLVGVASCADYLAGRIKKHELTRVDKEDDRVRHIDALNAQTGPAFLVHRADPDIAAVVTRATAAPPDVDFTGRDGIRHLAWAIGEPADLARLETAFARLPCLYIADGHHRSAAAGRVFTTRNGRGGSSHFLAVIFPHDQLQILPYHRVLKELPAGGREELRRRLQEVFVTVERPAGTAPGLHEVDLYCAGAWERLQFRPERYADAAPVDRLDVALLQRWVLEPVFGIANPRTSDRIGFVGGIRGPAELERLVNGGEAACAFALAPTRIEDLMTIADAGGIMPPKSTWFEPKLRDAMFCHLLD